MRKPDWTDFRQAMSKNGFNATQAINSLCKTFELADVLAVQKEYNRRVENNGIRGALQRQTCYLTSGSKDDIDLITKNGQAIAEQIRQGGKAK